MIDDEGEEMPESCPYRTGYKALWKCVNMDIKGALTS